MKLVRRGRGSFRGWFGKEKTSKADVYSTREWEKGIKGCIDLKKRIEEE